VAQLTVQLPVGPKNTDGHKIYFCSDQCRREFEADPAQYYDRIERQEPAYAVKNGIAVPTFGSAISGGLENEPGPERRDRR
jgi:hypothetical protein